MKYIINKDKKRRKNFAKIEMKQRYLKILLHGKVLKIKKLGNLIRKFHFITMRACSKVRIHNRCILTGRPKSVYRFCRLSRIKFRELASRGHMAGIRKSSW